jgi:UDP-glucose/galactose:(glucosyl)LPS alpha-1,2-glucosyl/galactosyltransferase
MTQRRPRAVACAADAGYLPHCATMLASLAGHDGPWDVHFLHDESVDDAELRKLVSMERPNLRVTPHRVGREVLEGLPRMRETTVAMWLRVLLPRLLPQDRVLYLDCDTLVVGDPAPLWELDLGDAAVGAVACALPREYSHWPSQLGVEDDRYFNSGVLLIDLARWRQEHLDDAVLSYGRQHAQRLRWPDQDALNMVFRGRWRALHARYNAQNAFWFLPEASQRIPPEELREAIAAPVIVHFEGPSLVKPWHRFGKNPYRFQYRRLRATTPWPLQTLEGEDHPLRALHWLPGRVLYSLLRNAARLRQWLHRLRA